MKRSWPSWSPHGAGRLDVQTVVVGVDGSAEGTEALRYAVGVAEAAGTGLLVVHAYQLPSHGPTDSAALAAAALAAAHRVTADALSQVTIPAGIAVETSVELTTPQLLLGRLSDQVAVIVLGQHSAGPGSSVTAQPVSSAVAARSSCPTVIVPRGWSQQRAWSRSIVVGLDDETSLRVVLGFAFGEAERRGWSVIALQALSLAIVSADQSARSADLAAILAVQRRDHPAVPVTVARTPDSLAQIVLDGSRRARLVVVGRPAAPRSRVGAWSPDAALRALEDLYCPVAVVPVSAAASAV